MDSSDSELRVDIRPSPGTSRGTMLPDGELPCEDAPWSRYPVRAGIVVDTYPGEMPPGDAAVIPGKTLELDEPIDPIRICWGGLVGASDTSVDLVEMLPLL